MAVHRPQPEYQSVRSRKTLFPLVAVREDPVETLAERARWEAFSELRYIGGRVYLQTRPVRRTDGKLTEPFGFSGYCGVSA